MMPPAGNGRRAVEGMTAGLVAASGGIFVMRPGPPSSRCVGTAEFAEIYAACAFAEQFGMPLDTSVTVAWSLFGYKSDAEVQAGFDSLIKGIRGWLGERDLPCAYIYAHERGERIGLHTHMLIYVPGLLQGERAAATRNAQPSTRRDFRKYLQDWVCRRMDAAVPRFIRVRGPSVETPWVAWMLMNYLMKGYDRQAVVQSAAHSPDGQEVRLGDLIAYSWRDPGVVTMTKRVGTSRTLGVERRAKGCPSDAYQDLAPGVRRVISPTFELMPASGSHRISRSYTEAQPFRSAFDDGVRDVRQLYPPEFLRKVTRLDP